jgi:hypothetical protein
MWYLLIAVFYSFSMIYVDSAIYVPGDVASTISRVLASEQLLRLGFVSCLAGHVCFLFLANALYRLFEHVDSDLARQMVILVVVGVSVAFLNRLNQFASLLLLQNTGYLAAFDPSQVRALAMVFLDLHEHGAVMATILWGLWLLPLGLLILKSNLIPRALGALLIGACLCYLVDFTLFFFLPSYMDAARPVLTIVETSAEVLFILWLLVKGVKDQVPAFSMAD